MWYTVDSGQWTHCKKKKQLLCKKNLVLIFFQFNYLLYLKLAPLLIQWKLVEPHWTDECDVGGLAVHHRTAGVDPQTGQLGQHVNHFVSLQVVDEDVGDPEILDELQRHGYVLGQGGVVGVGRVDVEPSLLPLHVEVGGEGDTVVLVVDTEHLFYIDSHRYVIRLLGVHSILFNTHTADSDTQGPRRETFQGHTETLRDNRKLL